MLFIVQNLYEYTLLVIFCFCWCVIEFTLAVCDFDSSVIQPNVCIMCVYILLLDK